MSKHNRKEPSIFQKTRGERIRKIIADAILGLFIIAVGVGYLGNYASFLPWEDFTIFFPGWGSLFLIVPAIYWLIRRPFSWFWPICLLFGVLILLSMQEQYSFGVAAAIVLAAFVILVGLRIIFAPVFKRIRRKKMQEKWRQKIGGVAGTTSVSGEAASDGVYHVSFGDRRVVIDENFTSATLSVTFGEMHFDLKDAIITDCAVIEANCSFGELNIHLPVDVAVEINNPTSAFGDIHNRHPVPADPGAPVVYISANCSFGEIQIH